METGSNLGLKTAHRIMTSIGVGVFAECGPQELRAIGDVPEHIVDMLGHQLNPDTGLVTLDKHGFLGSFIADTRNRLARRQQVDRDCVFFQERNDEGQEFAAKVWLVQEGEQRFYCIQPPDETDDYKRELLQRIRSSALASSQKPVPISIGTPKIAGDADAALVGELVEAIGAGLGVLDAKRDEVIINSTGRELLGLPSSMPIRIPSGRLRAYLTNTFFPRDTFAGFWQSFAATETAVTRVRRVHPYEVEVCIKSVPLADSELGLLQISEVASVATITSEQQATARRRQAEGSPENEEVGRITGGIAHEFNNLLTPIVGNLSLIEDGVGSDVPFAVEQLREGVAAALAAATRAAGLVADLLSCSNRSLLRVEVIDANAMAVELGEQIHAGEAKSCVLHLDLDDHLWPISGDGGMLRNLIKKLVNNALDARARDSEICVITRNCRLDDAEAARRAELEPGDYVVISVGDNGPGVPTELGQRIFEPFFSTKPPGEGVGLSLAAALGIARRHGGTLSCASSAGEGATFSLFLPRCTKHSAVPSAPSRPAALPLPAREAGKRGKRTVLIVDDEPLVRQLGKLALERVGYQTLIAADGVEALEQIDANPGGIDMILLDLTMPRMSGQETLAALAHRGSEIPIVISSGYVSKVDDLAASSPNLRLRMLDKPYQPAALIDIVSECMLDA